MARAADVPFTGRIASAIHYKRFGNHNDAHNLEETVDAIILNI